MELKNCPFCGSSHVESSDNWSDGDAAVHCYDCGGHMIASSEEEAKNKWNKRQSLKDQVNDVFSSLAGNINKLKKDRDVIVAQCKQAEEYAAIRGIVPMGVMTVKAEPKMVATFEANTLLADREAIYQMIDTITAGCKSSSDGRRVGISISIEQLPII